MGTRAASCEWLSREFKVPQSAAACYLIHQNDGWPLVLALMGMEGGGGGAVVCFVGLEAGIPAQAMKSVFIVRIC
jgi:hypothetical protein